MPNKVKMIQQHMCSTLYIKSFQQMYTGQGGVPKTYQIGDIAIQRGGGGILLPSWFFQLFFLHSEVLPKECDFSPEDFSVFGTFLIILGVPTPVSKIVSVSLFGLKKF